MLEKSEKVERLNTEIQNETTIEHLLRYAFSICYCKGKEVADIASGEGYGTNILSKYSKKIIGIDICAKTIEKAKNKYFSENILFQQGDAEKIPIEPNSLDTVVSFETIEHAYSPTNMLLEIKKILKPNGILLISTPNKKVYSDIPGYKNKFHIKEFYEQEFKDLLSIHFKNVKLLYQMNGTYPLIYQNGSTIPLIYEGNFDSINEVSANDASYFIAVCSNEQLPTIADVFFNSNQIFFSAGVINTKRKLAFKVGNLLLYPIKKIKEIFS